MGSFALAGNPNSGKTTIFNELTGARQYVGNWTGVTVEKKEGRMKGSDTIIVDLPGIYSLSSNSIDEIIARDYILKSQPDAILDIVDTSNIGRNLNLTLQLIELNVPVILILNMMDEIEKKGIRIDIEKLERLLGVKCIATSVKNRKTLKEISNIDIKSVNYKSQFSYLPQDLLDSVNKLSSVIDEDDRLKGLNSSKWLAMKLLENDKNVIDTFVKHEGELLKQAEIERLELEGVFKKPISDVVTISRFNYINEVIDQVVIDDNQRSRQDISDRIDSVLTNRFMAIPIFLGIMWMIYYITITSLGDKTIAFMEWLIGDLITGLAVTVLDALNVSQWMHSLVIDGILGGVGSVLVFVPQIMILFMFIAILEDSGYMTRIAFVMDRILRRFGLSGKSFIPLVIGSGCSVPAIMATRTLENENERKLTVLLTPFISCGAKLPIYVMFASAFFPKNAHWVVFVMYVTGIAVAMMSGIILSKFKYKDNSTGFIMEMPPYRIPSVKSVIYRMWDRGKEFLTRAGTVIFAASVILWFLQSFSLNLRMVEDPQNSILAAIGSLLTPIFVPLGFGNWKASVAFLTGFAAKEVVIGTLGVLQGVGEANLATSLNTLFTPVSAMSFMVFVLLASPCFAAMSAMKNELNSWKETGFSILYQTGTAWVVAMLVYQIGRLIV